MSGHWIERWPHWANRWWAVVLRILVAASAAAVGFLMVFAGYFAATFKKVPPEWTAESISLVVGGWAFGLAGLALAIRPSRITTALFVAVPVIFSIILMIVRS